MKQFTLSKVDKLGDADEKYGQTYWCETQEQLEPVMFNSMSQNISVGDSITAEEVLLKTSNKGKEYHRLKKVKTVSDGSQATGASSNAQTGSVSESQINQLLELVKENNDMLRKLTDPNYGKQGDVVVDPDDIDINSIPF